MNFEEFIQGTSEFYFGTPEAIPLVLVLYMIPIVVILALGYFGFWLADKIGRCFGYKSKADLAKIKIKEDLEKRFLDGYYQGKEDGIESEKQSRIAYRLEKDKQENEKLQKKLQHEEECQKKREQEILRLQQIKREVGKKFELSVKERLEKHFLCQIQNGKTKILHNIDQPGELDVQIDLVLIDTSGIYVIECKHWNGILVGKANWDKWIQLNYDGNIKQAKFEFYNDKYDNSILKNARLFKNPIMQVRRQVDKLDDLIQVKHKYSVGNKYKRLAVIQDDAHIDLVDSRIDDRYSYYTWFGKESELISTIEKYQRRGSCFTELQVEEIYKLLSQYTIIN